MSKSLETAGYDDRKTRKKEARLKRQTHYETIIENIHFNEENILTEQAHNKTVEEAEKFLSTECKSRMHFIEAMKVLQSKSQIIIRAHKLKCSLPQVPDVQEMPKQLRDATWFSYARSMHVWDDTFREIMSNQKELASYKREKLIGLVLFSAMSNGGLIDEGLILNLYHLLKKYEISIRAYDNIPHIKFKIRVATGSINYTSDDQYFRMVRWYIDPVTLMLLCEYISRNKSVDEKYESATDIKKKRDSLLRNIKHSLFNDETVYSHIRSIRKLGQAVLWPKESAGEIDISDALINMASNHYSNMDLNDRSFVNLHKQPSMKSRKIQKFDSLTGEEQKKKIKKATPAELDIFLKRLRACLNASSQAGKSASLNSTHVELLKIKEDHAELPVSIILLIDFFIHLASKDHKELKKTSALTTHYRTLTKAWVLEMYDQELDTLEEEDFIELYEEMIAFKDTDKSKEKLSDLLIRIHKFGMLQSGYNLPWLADWSKLKGYTSLSYVNARIIDHRYISAARIYLKEANNSKDDYEKLCFIMLLSFRTGLRIGEILKIQLRDLRSGILYVRSNKYGDNKSLSARRQINLYACFGDDEQGELRDFIDAQAGRSSSKSSELLFRSETGLKLKSSEVSNRIGEALKVVTNDPEIVFHNLRHSAANIFFAVIEKSWTIAEQLSGLPKDKLQELRRAIIGAEHNYRDEYFGLASFMGHAKPTHTMSSYLHISRQLFFQKLTAEITDNTYSIISEIAGIRKDSLRLSITSAELCGRILKTYKPSFVKKLKSDFSTNENLKANTADTPRAVGFFTTLQMLRTLELGYTVKQVAEIYSIGQILISSRLANAQMLHKVITREGKSRLFSAERLKSTGPNHQIKNLLTPGVKGSITELRDMEKIVQKLREKKELGFTTALQNWSWFVINATSTTHSHLSFHKKEKAALVVDLLTDVIPKNRWSIQIFVHSGSDKKKYIEEWKKIFPKGLKFEKVKTIPKGKRKNHPEGHVHIKLKHPSEADIIKKQDGYKNYSTNNLVNLAHMFLIIMEFPSSAFQ